MTAKRGKRVVGDVVEIALPDGSYGYAVTLEEATYGFYDLHSKNRVGLVEIITRPILFRVAVTDSAVKTGRWRIIGHTALTPEMLLLPPKFIQDPIDKNKFSIYENGKIRSAERQECLDLFRASVWSPEHVEERIVDHYAGRVNKWEIKDRFPSE